MRQVTSSDTSDAYFPVGRAGGEGCRGRLGHFGQFFTTPYVRKEKMKNTYRGMAQNTSEVSGPEKERIG